MRRRLLQAAAGALALTATSLAAPAAAETLRFYGYAWDLATGRYLYTETHAQQVEDGRWRGGTIRYYDPDGREFGRKSLDFAEDPFVPRYRLELSREGYFEAIARVRPLRLERGEPGRAPEARELALPEGACADSGFHAYIRAHFPAILAGATVRTRLVVAGSLDHFKFRIRRVGEDVFDGRPVVRLRVEPDSMLRFLAEPMELLYEPREMKLLEYRGISNVRDPAGGGQYHVRIAYLDRPPADVPVLPPLHQDESRAEPGHRTAP